MLLIRPAYSIYLLRGYGLHDVWNLCNVIGKIKKSCTELKMQYSTILLRVTNLYYGVIKTSRTCVTWVSSTEVVDKSKRPPPRLLPWAPAGTMMGLLDWRVCRPGLPPIGCGTISSGVARSNRALLRVAIFRHVAAWAVQRHFALSVLVKTRRQHL